MDKEKRTDGEDRLSARQAGVQADRYTRAAWKSHIRSGVQYRGVAGAGGVVTLQRCALDKGETHR